MRGAARRWAALSSAVGLALGCGTTGPSVALRKPYIPDKLDYVSFRQGWGELREPNYLPFMVHRISQSGHAGDRLLFCRWPDEQMPIDVYIEPPSIPAELDDEFSETDPQIFVDGAVSALDTWESSLEGLVRFRRTREPARAELTIHLIGAAGRSELLDSPEGDTEVLVLGSTPLAEACKLVDRGQREILLGEDPGVSYAAKEVDIYLADQHGLLTISQIERVILHEIGHALGMRGHSPVPVDLMYRAVQDRADTVGLSTADINSFVELYRLPNGAEFGRVSPYGDRPEALRPLPPSGRPTVAADHFVSDDHGFEIGVPSGWMREETRHGLFAANGPIWDHEVSLEVFVTGYPTIESYLAAYGPSLLAGTWLRSRSNLALKGHRGVEIVAEDEDGGVMLGFTFIELSGDRVMLVHTRTPADVAREWQPWFRECLASLAIADGT